MRCEGVQVRLGECVELLTGYPFKSAGYCTKESSVRLLRGDNIAQGTLRWDDARRWPKGGESYLQEYQLREGDVVLAMDRPWIAAGLKYAHIRQSDLPCLLVQRVARLRAKRSLDARFLRYVIGGQAFTDYVLAIQTGTAVPHISGGQVAAFEFLLPSMREQQEVGDLLGLLDDRIDLLHQTNATLESIAKALFKSWFIDFDPVRAKADGREPEGMDAAVAALFPAGFEESALGLIPKGWRPSAIRDVVHDVFDGPHATPPEATDGPVFLGIKNLTGTALDLGETRYISEDDWAQWTRRVTPRANDIVFSYEAALGLFALIPPDLRCCLGRRLALVRCSPIDGTPHFWFHQFVGGPFQRLLEKHTVHGATVNRIALKEFPSLTVLDPGYVTRRSFQEIAEPLWQRFHANQKQALGLAELRNTLLPRLISGKLRIPEAEEQVEAALA